MNSYFLYARKSSESEDRQILSIEQQLVEVREFAKKENLIVIDELTESMTAKQPGRVVFNKMLARIEEGEADGIIAWNPDRLARNSIDGGRIIYLVDTGMIKNLKFPTFRFDNNAYGKFILNIAFGQSKYYTDNLSENIKRGIRQKLRKGIWPNWAPLGYLNDPQTRAIVIDKEKAPYVKKLFQLYSTGDYSFRKLKNIFEEEGFIGKKNTPLSVSQVQHILRNIFYYGVFNYDNETYEGSHLPMITKQLFNKVQNVLKQRHRATRKKKYDFVFRGFIKCGECGASITAENKKKNKHRYIYYHCTKRKGKCSQPYSTTEPVLADQLSYSLSKIWLNDKTTKKILEDFNSYKSKEQKDITIEIKTINESLENIEQQLERLLDGYINALLDPSEYQSKKQKLIDEKTDLKQKLSNLQGRESGWFENAKEIIMTCNSVEKNVIENNYGNLYQIAKKAGSNFVLKDKALSFSYKKPFKFIFEKNFAVREEGDSCYITAEGGRPNFSFLFQKTDLCSGWRRGRDSNSRYKFYSYGGLANRWFQPLTHLSAESSLII